MYTILVTGSRGQLGNEIQLITSFYPDFHFIFTDIEELDVTHKNRVEQFVEENKINYIVNCAAYTAVDAAEDDVENSYRINQLAVKYIGETAFENNIKVIHVSTDYVFDGIGHIPYTENMDVSPTTVYGKSKLAGEQELLRACPSSVIIRTSWLYSSFGNNFVKTIIRLGMERDSLNVVFDQIGTPTYAADLAEVIMNIIIREKFTSGIYHYSNEGVCSWYDFAKSIHRLAGIECQVNPIETKDYPVRSPRPFYSVLNKSKIKSIYSLSIPHWEESLEKCIKLLIK